MPGNYIQLPTLGLHHFCIRHNNIIDKLKANYLISDLSELQTVSTIDWSFIFEGDEDSKNFILLTDVEDWSYLIWNHWSFNENLQIAKELSSILRTTVNYYFVDSQIATSRWIFAESGQITRAYYESHGKIIQDTGINTIENYLRDTVKETFVEDIYWALYEKTSLSLENFNKRKQREVKLYTGTMTN